MGFGKASAWSLHAIDAATLPAGGLGGTGCCLGAGVLEIPGGKIGKFYVMYIYIYMSVFTYV